MREAGEISATKNLAVSIVRSGRPIFQS
jgi:hypothetical protein